MTLPGMTICAPIAAPETRARTVRIIGPDNGAGLSRDREIVATAFLEAGWDAVFADPSVRRPAVDHVAVNVHLEFPTPHLIGDAKTNVVIPNPEWWAPSPILADPSVSVWAKTSDAARIFRDLGARVEHIGFRSADRYDPMGPRHRSFLHVAGASVNKGTDALISCWREGWPRLTVVSWREIDYRPPPNVTALRRISSAEDLRRLQNEHTFHIYPARYEGHGHAQWEGLSCGAIVFATDGPPFDEYPEAFRLLPASAGGQAENGLVRWRDVPEEAIAAAVFWASMLSDDEIDARSAHSRREWERTAAAFSDRMAQVIGALA